MHTLPAYLLTRQWRDTPQGLEYEFWASSDTGPVKLLFTNQEAVCFIEREQHIHLPPNCRRSAVDLRNFHDQAVDALYFSQQSSMAQCHQQHQAILHESDIKPSDRFLMERFITGALNINGSFTQENGYRQYINPRVTAVDYQPHLHWVSLDIETEDLDGKLYSIAVASEAEHIVFMNGDCKAAKVHACKDERDVIQQWLAWMSHRDPDIIYGWNVISFDLDFLVKRAQQLKIPFNLGRGNAKATVLQPQDNQGIHVARIPGRVVLDGITTLRTATWSFERFELEYVAHQLLGKGKLLHEVDQVAAITELYQNNKAKLAAYNLEDAQLVVEIAEKTELLSFAIQRSNMTGLAMDRAGGSVAAFDHLYLPRLHRHGFVAPNVGTNPNQQHSPGGFVMDSQPGLFRNVLVLDFKSLYPSIIRSFKIDPLGLVQGNERDIPGFLGSWFSRDKHILPDLISDLWALRDGAKKENKSALSQAIKIIMNSFYGVLGSFGCRFFDQRLASSITLRGHQIINESRECIESQGYSIIYGDTDSIFVLLGETYKAQQAKTIGDNLANDLNHWWQQRLKDEYGIESALEIEFETHYSRFYMPTIRGSDKGSKKRYAGWVDEGNGKLIVKGLESARSDWTQLARTLQTELLTRIFNEQPYRDYIQETLTQVLNGHYDQQLIYRKRLRKPLDSYVKNVPPHVRAARQLPQHGRWIEYVITTQGPQPLEQQSAPLDYEHYINKQLAPSADGILSFMNDSVEAIREQQLGLF